MTHPVALLSQIRECFDQFTPSHTKSLVRSLVEDKKQSTVLGGIYWYLYHSRDRQAMESLLAESRKLLSKSRISNTNTNLSQNCSVNMCTIDAPSSFSVANKDSDKNHMANDGTCNFNFNDNQMQIDPYFTKNKICINNLPFNLICYIGSYFGSKEILTKWVHVNRYFLLSGYKPETHTLFDFTMSLDIGSKKHLKYPPKYDIAKLMLKLKTMVFIDGLDTAPLFQLYDAKSAQHVIFGMYYVMNIYALKNVQFIIIR